jgi:alcohol dehydrogenase, propanol-preferring
MKAAVVHDFTKPLSIEDVPMPEPGAGQVLVRVESSGLCHTDIHAAHGDWPVKPNLPLIPGHEGVGIVEGFGPGAGPNGVKEGDRVAIPWLGYACGHCRYCNNGWETLCEEQSNTGYFMDGAYAEYVAAYARHVVKVPDGVDIDAAAPLTCAGVTTYKAVKVSGARPAQLAAVFGIGGLGHMALQYAKIQGATTVAVDVHDDKLEMAKRLGADFVVNAAEQDAVAEIKKLGGADAAIATAVSPKAFESAYQSLARGGTLVFVGLPADNHVQLPIFETVLNGITIKGSIVGTHQDLEDVFRLHQLGRTEVLYETRSLDDVNEAFAEVEEARTKQPRVVLKP